MRQKKLNIVSQLIHYLSTFTVLAVCLRSALFSLEWFLYPSLWRQGKRRRHRRWKKNGFRTREKYIFLSLSLSLVAKTQGCYVYQIAFDDTVWSTGNIGLSLSKQYILSHPCITIVSLLNVHAVRVNVLTLKWFILNI